MSSFDQESIVYGVIRHCPAADEFTARLQRRSNWSAVQALPTGIDDEWSLLCREMFSMPGDDQFSGTFQTQLMLPIVQLSMNGSTGWLSLRRC